MFIVCELHRDNITVYSIYCIRNVYTVQHKDIVYVMKAVL